MLKTIEFFQAQAAACAAEAETTALENVRDRWLRAQHAWLELADRPTRRQRRKTPLAAIAEPGAGE